MVTWQSLGDRRVVPGGGTGGGFGSSSCASCRFRVWTFFWRLKSDVEGQRKKKIAQKAEAKIKVL